MAGKATTTGSGREKTWLLYANNKGADQPAQPLSLIGAYVIHLLISNVTPLRTLVKCVTKFNFLISQPKHMLWVLKRTVSMIRFF